MFRYFYITSSVQLTLFICNDRLYAISYKYCIRIHVIFFLLFVKTFWLSSSDHDKDMARANVPNIHSQTSLTFSFSSKRDIGKGLGYWYNVYKRMKMILTHSWRNGEMNEIPLSFAWSTLSYHFILTPSYHMRRQCQICYRNRLGLIA